jgi:hypothetical protein
LFTLALRLKRAVWRDRAHAAELAHGVRLADLRAHLTLVAHALSGAPLDIQEAEHAGGFAGDVLYLPRAMSFAEDPEANALAYLYRVAYTVTSRQLGYVLSAEYTQAVELTTLATLLAVPPTLAALEAELPMIRALRQRFFPLVLRSRPPRLTLRTPAALLEACTQVLLGRDLEVWRDQEREHRAGWEWLQRSMTIAWQSHGSAAARTLYASLYQSVGQKDATPVGPVMLWGQLMPAPPWPVSKKVGATVPQTPLPTGTEQRGKAKEQVRRVELNQQDIDNDVLIHTFEKIETAEEFCGVTRTPDGADELAQHAKALDALDLRDVVRSHTQTRSMYQANVTLDGAVGDVEAACNVRHYQVSLRRVGRQSASVQTSLVSCLCDPSRTARRVVSRQYLCGSSVAQTRQTCVRPAHGFRPSAGRAGAQEPPARWRGSRYRRPHRPLRYRAQWASTGR